MDRRNRMFIAVCGTALLMGGAGKGLSQVTSPSILDEARAIAATQPALPARHPALPAGHPALPDAASPSTQPALPAGHPALPEGHPQVGDQTQGMSPPAGHPDMSQMKAAATTRPTTFGKLTIKAVQSTKGGPAVGADPVFVEIYRGAQLLKTEEGKLGADGTLVIANIPFGPEIQSIVKLNHADAEYWEVVDPSKTDQTVTVPVYESTEQKPDWQVKMRHVMVEPVEGGLQVIDMIAVDNPTDKSWLGEKDASGQHVSFSVPLPAGAKDVQVGGSFHECCVKIEKDRIVNNMAITPGTTKYEVLYVVPTTGGKGQIITTAPAATKMMMVVLLDDGTTVSAEELQGPMKSKMGDVDARFYQGANIPAGKTLKLSIGGIAQASPAGNKPSGRAAANDASQMARLLAGAGGLVVFIVGGAFMFFKAPKNAKKNR